MSAGDVLRASESAALESSQEVSGQAAPEIASSVAGKARPTSSKKKVGSWSAAIFITMMIVVFLVIFGSGNLIPAAISERLIEETDVQYADAVESKMLVFQQAMRDGSLPENTVKKLNDFGVLVGTVQGGEFVEGVVSGQSLALKMGDKIITAEEFIVTAHSDINLYDAFNKATYSRAAYYYDEPATSVIQRIGTTRDNYAADSDFDAVMDRLMGQGSNVKINNVTRVEKEDDDGNKYYEYDKVGADAVSGSGAAASFVENVRADTWADTTLEATMYAADELNIADTLAKEQRSSLFFLSFMENISKMKAGEGNESQIHEAMNYLYNDVETSVVDTATGQTVTTYGSMLEAPSLYAMLSGEQVRAGEVMNYASDRVLKTVEGKMGVNTAGDDTLLNTVASTKKKTTGSIGRFLWSIFAGASGEALTAIVPTVNDTLIENSFDTVGGVKGGEFLAEGAVTVGKELAKMSGGTAGDAAAAKAYAQLNTTVLALDAEADRMNRSPFDVTSKNTFLGLIVYKMAVAMRLNTPKSGVAGIMGAVGRVVSSAVGSLLPASYADDGTERYLANFGGSNTCETISSIGAVGSVGCTEIATFDTSTLNDTFNDPEFVAFVEENTTLENGARKVKTGSDLAHFITYNDERITPIGILDGGILQAVMGGSSSIPFISDILTLIKIFLGASDHDKAVANGTVFVNSSSNAEWQTYKYAQRYVSLARATDALRQYDGEATAYSGLRYFEGVENPVVAFTREYYASLGE